MCARAHRPWSDLHTTLPVTTASCLSLMHGGYEFTSVPFASALMLDCMTQSAQSVHNHSDLGPLARGFSLALGSTRICLPFIQFRVVYGANAVSVHSVIQSQLALAIISLCVNPDAMGNTDMVRRWIFVHHHARNACKWVEEDGHLLSKIAVSKRK